MTRNPLRSSDGFTYIAALVMVVIMGIMLSQGAQYWSVRMQREREAELLFHGRQVRNALRLRYGLTLNTYGSYVAPGTTLPPGTKPPVVKIPANAPRVNELKDLLQAPESAGKKHFLRPSDLKVADPYNGKQVDWELYKDPATGRITGVYIKSEAEPIKQAKFDDDLEPRDFEGKKKYSEWIFICDRYPSPPGTTGGVTGLGGSATPGGTGSPGTGNPTGNPMSPSTNPIR